MKPLRLLWLLQPFGRAATLTRAWYIRKLLFLLLLLTQKLAAQIGAVASACKCVACRFLRNKQTTLVTDAQHAVVTAARQLPPSAEHELPRWQFRVLQGKRAHTWTDLADLTLGQRRQARTLFKQHSTSLPLELQ